MKTMRPGEPVFFRLKDPHNAIAGYGFYAHYCLLGLDEAWDVFGWKNGDPDKLRFLQRIGRYRGIDLLDPAQPRAEIACTILRDARFWSDRRIAWAEAEGWQRNIVQGKTESDPARASRLLAEIAYDATEVPEELVKPFAPVNVDERTIVLSETVRREGQGTFRARLMTAYDGHCAITGEHTELVLDAAHIQPYLGPRSNHLQNGLLLTKEFHALFDRGYVSVTPDYRVRVSQKLRERWSNGRRYYPFDGEPLAHLPRAACDAPSRAALEWHSTHVFLG